MTTILFDIRQLKNAPEWLEELSGALTKANMEVVVLNENGSYKNEKERKKHYKTATLWVNLGHGLPRDWQEIIEKGIIAVIKEDLNPIFENYTPEKEIGNSFLFESCDKYDVFAAIIRALENYKFPYDWENIKEASRKLAS